ncbi:MAG: hypothetical protein QXM75_01670 [Candidatus Diapherotrites archaeon]
MYQSAQLSLEFLIVITIAISLMCLMVPVVSKAYERAFSIIDAANARLFASELKGSIKIVKTLSSGSEIFLKCNPLQEWILVLDDAKISITTGSHKIIIEPNTSISSPKSNYKIKGTNCFILRKEKEGVLLLVRNC